jgi:hypothetical protein
MRSRSERVLRTMVAKARKNNNPMLGPPCLYSEDEAYRACRSDKAANKFYNKVFDSVRASPK